MKKDEELTTEDQVMSGSETLPYVHSPRSETATTSALTENNKITKHETKQVHKIDKEQIELHKQEHYNHDLHRNQKWQEDNKESKSALELPLLSETEFAQSHLQSETALLSAINSNASTFASALLDKKVSTNKSDTMFEEPNNVQSGVSYSVDDVKNNHKALGKVEWSKEITNSINNTKENEKVKQVQHEHCKVHCTPLDNLLDHNVYTEEEVLLELEALRKRALLTSTPFNKHILPILTWYVLRDKFGEDAASKYVSYMNVNPTKTGSEALPESFLPQINEIRRNKRASHDAFNANPYHHYNITPPRSSLLTHKFEDSTTLHNENIDNKKTDNITRNKNTDVEMAQKENIADTVTTNKKLSEHNTESNEHDTTNAMSSATIVTSTNNNTGGSGLLNKLSLSNAYNNKNSSSRNSSDVSKETKLSSLPSTKSNNPRRICSFDLLASQSEMPIEPISTTEVMTKVLMAENCKLHNNTNNNNTNNNIDDHTNVIAGQIGNNHHNSSHTSSNSTFSSLLTSVSTPKFVLPETVRREYDKLSKYTTFRKSMDAAEEKMEMESVVDVKLVAEPVLQTQNTFRIVPRSQMWTPSTPTNSDGSNHAFIVNSNINNNTNTNSSYGSANSKMSNHSSTSNNSNLFIHTDANSNRGNILSDNMKISDNIAKYIGSYVSDRNTENVAKANYDFKENEEKANVEINGDRENVNNNNNNNNISNQSYYSFLSFHNPSNLSQDGEEEQPHQHHFSEEKYKYINNDNHVCIPCTQSTLERLTSCTPDMEKEVSNIKELSECTIAHVQIDANMFSEAINKEILDKIHTNTKNNKDNVSKTEITNNAHPLHGLTETETSSTLSSLFTSAHTREIAKAPLVHYNIISTEQHYKHDATHDARVDINTIDYHNSNYKCTDTPLQSNGYSNNNKPDEEKNRIKQKQTSNEENDLQLEVNELQRQEQCQQESENRNNESDKLSHVTAHTYDGMPTKQVAEAVPATAIVALTESITHDENNNTRHASNDSNNTQNSVNCINNNYKENDGDEKVNVTEGKNDVLNIRMWEMPEYASVPELLSYDLALLPYERESSNNTCHSLHSSSHPTSHLFTSSSTSYSSLSANMPNTIQVGAITTTTRSTLAVAPTAVASANTIESINSSVVSSSLEPSCNYQTRSDKSESSLHSMTSSSTANMNSSLLLNYSGSTKAPQIDVEDESNVSSSVTTRSTATTTQVHEQIIDMINSSIKTMHLAHRSSNSNNADKSNNTNKWKYDTECNNSDNATENNNNNNSNTSEDKNSLLSVVMPMEKVKSNNNTVNAKDTRNFICDQNTHHTYKNDMTNGNAIQNGKKDTSHNEKSDVCIVDKKIQVSSPLTNNAHSTLLCVNHITHDNSLNCNNKNNVTHLLYNKEEEKSEQEQQQQLSRVTFNSQLQLVPSPELSSNIGESLMLRHQSEQDANEPSTQTKSVVSNKSNNSETSVNSSVFDVNRFETALQRLLTEEQHATSANAQLTEKESIQLSNVKDDGDICKKDSKINSYINTEECKTEPVLESSSFPSAASLTHDVSSATLSRNGGAADNNNNNDFHPSSNINSSSSKDIECSTNTKYSSNVKQNGKVDCHDESNEEQYQEQNEEFHDAYHKEIVEEKVSSVNNAHAVANNNERRNFNNNITAANVKGKCIELQWERNEQENNKVYASPRPARRFHALGASSTKMKKKNRRNKKKALIGKKNGCNNYNGNGNENSKSQTSSSSSLPSSLTHSPSPPLTASPVPISFSSLSSSSSSWSELLNNTNTKTERSTSPTTRPPLHPYSNPRPPSSGASATRFTRSYNAETARPASAFVGTSTHEFVLHHSVPIIDISNVPYVPSPNESTDADRESVQHTRSERVRLAQQWAERGRAWRLHEERSQVDDS